MTTTPQQVKELAKQLHPQVVQWRRHLHQHPELSFKEHKTAAYVKERLQELGLQPKSIADTGVVALIEGKKPESRTIALRGDMDALPITEANNVPYKSQNEGVMHACGHDVHTSSLLGTAAILTQLREQFTGTVKLIFQPGEELLPGGASLLIKEGVLEKPKPAGIFGQHVFPFLPVGTVGFRSGMYMASADEIYFTIKGKGGHAALPDLAIDPVLIGSHIIVALQQIVSRRASPKTPSVLSFGDVRAAGATNVIPNEYKVQGTFRTLDEEWREQAHKHIEQLITQTAEAMGATAEVDIKKGYPCLHNAPELTELAQQAAREFLGDDKVVDLDLWMGAEDFAFYTHHTDACFYRLGTRNEKRGITSSVHTPTFDIDEDALETGPGLMAWLALKRLEQ
jgi:amidohydrolase